MTCEAAAPVQAAMVQVIWKRFTVDQPPNEGDPLHRACWDRQPAAVRAALAAGADPNGRSSSGSPPLLTLCLERKVPRREPDAAVVSIALQLLAAGADVNGGDERGCCPPPSMVSRRWQAV